MCVCVCILLTPKNKDLFGKGLSTVEKAFTAIQLSEFCPRFITKTFYRASIHVGNFTTHSTVATHQTLNLTLHAYRDYM